MGGSAAAAAANGFIDEIVGDVLSSGDDPLRSDVDEDAVAGVDVFATHVVQHAVLDAPLGLTAIAQNKPR